ncbi:MAG: monodechloroaminopyrrolnitrin synthase PrnB family protein [Minisyncoccia bacterium]
MGTDIKLPRVYAECVLDDHIITTLDPLGADEFFMKELPKLNMIGDIQQIYETFAIYLHLSDVRGLSKLEAAAATRDVAIVASSLVRHGAEIQQFPELETTLIKLSEVSDEIPADTVTSYGPRNPCDHRMRTFTGEPEERSFILCVVEGMRSLPAAVAALDVAQEYPPDGPEFSRLVRVAADNFAAMISSIAEVNRRITPEYFTSKLRPYFEPKVIGGKKYLAPGGAQMPIILIDLALWSGEDNNSQYVRYWNENIGYLPAKLRIRAQKIVRSGSLLQKLKRWSDSPESSRQTNKPFVMASLDAVEELIVALQKFRYPHLKIAEANMAVRPKGAVGSGGYNTDILKLLIANSEFARKTIQELRKNLN